MMMMILICYKKNKLYTFIINRKELIDSIVEEGFNWPQFLASTSNSNIISLNHSILVANNLGI